MPSGFIGSTPQAACHPERKMHCKGLCKQCYYNLNRSEYNKVYQKEYNKVNPTSKKRGHLKLLGWTLELFNKVLEEQKGKCAICSKDLNLDKKQNGARACADHEHCIPPKHRGILCTNCNAMLGQAQENTDILRAGAVYLEKFLSETTEETKHLIVST
jgi:hypothetical protein